MVKKKKNKVDDEFPDPRSSEDSYDLIAPLPLYLFAATHSFACSSSSFVLISNQFNS